jgi:hypothetical protein
MAGPKIPDGAQKRKRIKKKKSRTEGMSVFEAVMRNVADQKKFLLRIAKVKSSRRRAGKVMSQLLKCVL